jgi:hypothetical protein
MIVQHYVEEIGQQDHLRQVSTSDVFTPTGRTKIGVIRDLSARKIDDKTCEFTNTVQSCATPELLDFPGKQGIPLDVGRPQAGFRGTQSAGDADVRKKHRTSCLAATSRLSGGKHATTHL